MGVSEISTAVSVQQLKLFISNVRCRCCHTRNFCTDGTDERVSPRAPLLRFSALIPQEVKNPLDATAKLQIYFQSGGGLIWRLAHFEARFAQIIPT